MKRNQKGFTLMELMVVIVIVAILAAVAVPLYINYVKDATRSEAKGAIGAVITAEQTFYQLNANGGTPEYQSTTFVSSPQPGQQDGLNCDLTESLKNWDISVTASGSDGFTADAVGKPNTPAAGLEVHYTFSRSTTIVQPWREV